MSGKHCCYGKCNPDSKCNHKEQMFIMFMCSLHRLHFHYRYKALPYRKSLKLRNLKPLFQSQLMFEIWSIHEYKLYNEISVF